MRSARFAVIPLVADHLLGAVAVIARSAIVHIGVREMVFTTGC